MKRILFLAILCVVIIFVSLQVSEGAVETDITGFAWSSNIGWISFHGSNYGVKINQDTDELSGHAWSSNIGWISFDQNDLIGCPTTPCSARLNGTTFEGWARVTIADGNGWDGWIHLSNEEQYSLELDTTDGTINGFAWGGEVVGWIKSINLAATVEGEEICGDGIDNDGDGEIDENCGGTCTDGDNNDTDGFADDGDIDCGVLVPPNPYVAPLTESVYNPQCHNGQDDDGDGSIDFNHDPDCISLTDDTESDSVTPEVDLKVGINAPSFDSLTIGKGNQNVVLGVMATHLEESTVCSLTTVVTNKEGVSTAGEAREIYRAVEVGEGEEVVTEYEDNNIPLTITNKTRATVMCVTGERVGSDSVEIIIKNENEF